MNASNVIYTVISGNYDDLRQPEIIVPGWDYICFSNDLPEKKIGVWQIRRFNYHHEIPIRESRFPKLNPHLVLPDYEYSLYVDANIIIGEKIHDRLLNLMSERIPLLAMIPHPDRDCVYQEAMILTVWKIGEANLIFRHVLMLLNNKVPPHAGLFAGGVIFRKHNAPQVISFSRNWWNQYRHFSYRDQMGITWALRQTKLEPEIFLPSSFLADNIYLHRMKRKRLEDLSWSENLLRYFNVFRLKMLLLCNGIGSLE